MLKQKKYILFVFHKNNSNHEKQVILLMIQNRGKCKTNSEGQWYYLAVEKYQHY